MKKIIRTGGYVLALLQLLSHAWLATVAHATVTVTSDVFVGGGEGPQGTSNYRIPGMTVALDGTILAFAEGRRSGSDPGQAGAPIDLVMKRSTNGGLTWEPLVVLEANSAFDYDDPTPVVDAITGDVHLLYGRVPDGCGLFCVPAGTGTNSMNVWQMISSDNGQNWSVPIDLTSQVKDPAWRGIVPGPGSGIQLRWQDNALRRNGRLVVPASINANRNLVLYSDNHGETWHHGKLAQDDLGLGGSFNGNENEVVELTNGDLLMNARPNGGSSRRMFRSSDGGVSWVESYAGPSPITTVDASMIRYSAVRDDDDRDRILFSGPLGNPVGSGSGRSNIGVWTSYDEGRTFTNPVQLGSGHAAYSVLQKLPDDSIGLLYEATGSTLISYIGFDILELEPAIFSSDTSQYAGFGNPVSPLRGGVGWSGAWATTGNVNFATDARAEFSGVANVFDSTFGLDQEEGRLDIAGGGDATRSLAAPIDLNSNETNYFALMISKALDTTSDDPDFEALEIELLDSAGTTHASFGVTSSEAFTLGTLGNTASTASNALVEDDAYFLIGKIVSQDASIGGNFDQLFLHAFAPGDIIPQTDSEFTWALVGSTNENSSASLEQISLSGESSATWSVDALRLGSTWESVQLVSDNRLGDLNDDLLIDLADWLLFRGSMALDTSGISILDREGVGDFDKDGLIDLHDFTTFVELYDAANGVGAFAKLLQVPEPTTTLLLLLGTTSLVNVRRRTRNFVYSKQCLQFILVSCLLVPAHDVAAAFDGFNVDSSTFDNLYEGNDVFNGTNFWNGWAVAGGSDAADYVLNTTNLIHTVDSNNGWIEHDNGTSPWELGSGSWTVETRAHVVATGNSGFNIWGALNGERNVMQIDESSISNLGVATFDTEDNTDGFHTFRLVYDATGNAYHYFRDGVQVTPLEGIAQQASTGQSRLIFGDCCSGFAGTGSIVEYDYFRYDMDGAFSPTGANELKLQVNTTTGIAVIVNDGAPYDFDMNSYLVTSEGESLSTSAWNSLQAQDVTSDPTPENKDNGDSWEEYEGSDSEFLGEAFLLGSTHLANGNSLLLGEIFDVNKPRDLKFTFSSLQFGVLKGTVEYIIGPDDADFDDDADVDGADFLTWQRGFGMSGTNATGDADSTLFVNGLDLHAWEAQYGTTPISLAAAVSIPEPNSSLLFIVGLLTWIQRRGLSDWLDCQGLSHVE